MTKYSLNPMNMVLTSMLLSSLVATGRAGSYTPHPRSAPLQEEERVFEKLSRRQEAPLQIGTIKRKRGETFLGKKFVDREDWFQGLSFVMENTSGKTIVYVRGGFLFPRQIEMKGQVPPLYHSFRYGLPPSLREGAGSDAQQLALKPGETMTFTLSESAYNEITANLRRLEYTHSIKLIKFNLEEIFFDDGTSWAAGAYFPRDQGERRPLGGILENYSAPTRSNFVEISHFGELRGFFWLHETPPAGRTLQRPDGTAAWRLGTVYVQRRILHPALLRPADSCGDKLLQEGSMDSPAPHRGRTQHPCYGGFVG